MTAWTPEWRIKVNGSTLTNITLSDLSITSGRTSIYEQATASYCNINLILGSATNAVVNCQSWGLSDVVIVVDTISKSVQAFI